MKKRDWGFVFIPLIISWIVDRVTKHWANTHLNDLIDWGMIKISLHHNPGAMLGLFSDLPAVLRIVSLSTGGAFLVCIYALIQYLLPIRSMTLRVGLSLLLGGILGNVSDRIIWGYVVDFIIFSFGDWHSPVFNPADAIQWVGYAMVAYALVREGDLLWPENNLRKEMWINPKFQLKYCFILLGVGFSISLIAAVFSYTYFRVTLIEVLGQNPYILKKFLGPFIFTFAILTVAFAVGLFAVGKVISHKIAGPIYAFEKYVKDLTDQKTTRDFKLRTKDEFKELEELAAKLKARIVPTTAPAAGETPVNSSQTVD